MITMVFACLSFVVHIYQRLSDEERKRSPLMLASMGGRAKCVTLLLEKGADVSVVSGRNYNCLMEATERGHK